ncbi:hypothetical protein [Vibrio agarivorans]|uniref:Porin n=1 Tax=Vibrio agarivorans TaxID=153622 RepID=A0ABT7XYI5_9VIBR|nr:hypothetical protein [Vibrio agarivorans]MDN2480847.1 hypothetical protein [Vibrio agarivorans]
MKKLLLAFAIMSSCGIVYGQETETVNYGDPTASFSSLGVSGTEGKFQVNGMVGLGKHIFQLDLGYDKDTDKGNYRGRYFHVTEGLGYSVDVLGDKDSTTGLAGVIYKMDITDNISLFPMASVGYTSAKDDKGAKSESALAQAGLYGMYAFDSGHWVYANPKATYHEQSKEWLPQFEVGAGYMIMDNASIGTKVEYTAESSKKGLVKESDTVAWLQANYYF